MTTTADLKHREGPGVQATIQRIGGFLAGMIMPNIAAFIAWGLITALFIPTGWWPNEQLATLVGPMILSLLPILIGYTGGRLVHGQRGAVVGAVATMGVVVGTDIPMFLGAMIIGPLAAWILKQIDGVVQQRTRSGFEMLVDNFSAGILGVVMAILGLLAVGPVVETLANAAGEGVDFLVNSGLLPLVSIIVEPAKVLFLNNAINHGVLTPLGSAEALENGKSVLFLLEANPGPGLGLLLAFTVFGRGLAKASAPGAAIIQFLGGIHEIYFPYVLMKPKLIVAMIAGGMTGVFINVLFDVGLRAPAAPGSIFAVYAQTASDSYIGVTLSVLGSAAVTFVVAGLLLKTDKAEEGDLTAATADMEAMKGKKSVASSAIVGGSSAGPISNIVFACDAGMGSSAMGASVLRKKIHAAGYTDVTVVNKAIANLTDDVDVVVTHQDLTARAQQRTPSAVHVSVDNFMSSPKYDEIVEMVRQNNSVSSQGTTS